MKTALPQLIIFCLALPLCAQTKEITVKGDQTWVDTGMDVKAGYLIRFEASGSLKYADAREACGPDGLARGWKDMIRILPLNDVGRGALLGRVGSGDAVRPFLIGAKSETRMVVDGRLFLGINQQGGSPEGSYTVRFEVIGRSDDAAKSFKGALPPVTAEHLAKIPRRVVDKDGNEGDRVNFLILGTEEQVKSALAAVGWVVVDRNVKDTILRGALGSLSKQAYLTMPMSELMLFGRVQDYGYAHSDPLITVMARHHFRIWKAPFEVGGLQLWVGAGTHDIGFDKDQRNGKITHKIDPDTDKEREFIAESLKQSGQVVKTDFITPKDALTKAKTAHGEEFYSDGRILVVYLKPETQAAAASFGDYFCSVLEQNNPDGEQLGACDAWIQTPGKKDRKLGELSKQYRVLIVPGIMNTCVSDRPAFEKGRQVLEEKYGLSVELLSVPNNSSESNANLIARHISEKSADDQRKFIVVGYSKGTPDLQTALATDPALKNRVAAFISVAGASGGSPIADSLPAQLDAYMNKVEQGKCEGDLAEGFKSLKKETRQRFLASNPHSPVPTYSLATLIPEGKVPKSAAQTYQMLSAWDKQNDSQLLKMDQILPESTYLGVMWSDHLNVALAMGGQFPRAALLEALIRFVEDDLARK
jgi:hypothetical protein